MRQGLTETLPAFLASKAASGAGAFSGNWADARQMRYYRDASFFASPVTHDIDYDNLRPRCRSE